jgi:hypothetical protein
LETLPVRLSFKLDDFCARVKDGKVPLSEKKAQPGLDPQRLTAEEGPRIIVDQDGKFVMFYAPDFWGFKTQVRRRQTANDRGGGLTTALVLYVGRH